ncbi:MAG: 5-methyltetrahydropteroyltriglutamate--homocysteine methyltransferase, partial [Candidatus Acidiferrum sp.]
MPIPTEAIGSIPRPAQLLAAISDHAAARISHAQLHAAEEAALRDTLARLEETGSPVISDGEQTKPSFVTYPLAGLTNLAPDGPIITFADGHTRQLPRLASGPFRYAAHAASYLKRARAYTQRPLKQAVISASALSLLYPQEGLPQYSREVFLGDLANETARDIRECLQEGAHCVQLDFTEGRLALKLDPSGRLLRSFIDLNNHVLARFTDSERRRIGVHTCPGGDRDSTHSANVDYAKLLPLLFQLNVGQFYIQMASEADRRGAFKSIRASLEPGTLLF